MKISIQKKIGNTLLTFEVEEPKTMDALMEAGFISQTPDVCKCGSKDVQLTSNKAKGFMFIKVVCLNCRAKAEMGQYKDGGYFWKQFKDWEGQTEEPPTIDDVF